MFLHLKPEGNLFLKMGQSRPLFVYFRSFLLTISIQIEKSIDGVLGIQTRGHRMVGADTNPGAMAATSGQSYKALYDCDLQL